MLEVELTGHHGRTATGSGRNGKEAVSSEASTVEWDNSDHREL